VIAQSVKDVLSNGLRHARDVETGSIRGASCTLLPVDCGFCRSAIDSIALAHGVEARGGVGVEEIAMAFDERDDLVAEIAPAS
jgi:hypothetical protein